jgi:inner membrane protein
MLKTTHLSFATFTYLTLVYYNIFNFNLFNLIVVLVSALISDIDIKTSKLGKKFKFLSESFKHRGFFHSLLFFILMYIILTFTNTNKQHYFLIGYLSHLILDAMNYKGINWCWPLKKKIKGFCKTNSITEKIIFIFTFFANLYLLLIMAI